MTQNFNGDILLFKHIQVPKSSDKQGCTVLLYRSYLVFDNLFKVMIRVSWQEKVE